MSRLLGVFGRVLLLRTFILLNLFFVALFGLAEIKMEDLSLSLLVMNVQISLGGLIWIRMRSQRSFDLSEFFGMGGAVGFGLSLISSQLFRTIIPFSISWIVLPVLSLVVLQIRSRCSLHNSLPKFHTPNDLLFVFSGTLIALSTSWYWLVSTAIAIFLWTVWHFLRVSNRSAGLSKTKWQGLLVVAAVAMSIRALIHLSELTEIRNSLWWNLRYGVMQDPDSIFHESMVQSTTNFGGGSNIFFKDLRFYYHWFSFAWESTLGAVSAPDPFVISAIMGPAIVLFVILCLVSRLAKLVSSSSFSGPVAVYVISMMCAGPIPFLRVLHPYSFSFNFALIYILGIGLVTSLHHEFRSKSFALIILFLSTCLVGSKVTFVPIVLVGLFCCAILETRQKPRQYNFLLAFFTTLFVVVVAFFTIYSFGQQSGSSYVISFADILWQKGNLEKDLPFFVVLISFLSTSALVMSPALGLFFFSNAIPKNMLLMFSTMAGLAGVALAFILSDSFESNSYFIQAGLALLIPASVALSLDKFRVDVLKHRFFTMLAIFVCLELARWWPKWYRNVSGEGLLPFYKTSFIMGIPVLAAFLCLIIANYLRLFRNRTEFKQFFCVLLIATSAGSYYANAEDFLDKGIWASQNVRFTNSDTISGSKPNRVLLFWLRDNSNRTDLVATNRYCSVSTDTPPECLSRWSLTSAITGRQMLSEGSWTTDIVRNLKDEPEKRRTIVETFVNSPAKKTHALLLNYGVRWVVADYAVTNTRNWGEFAEVRFENEAGAILELSPKTP